MASLLLVREEVIAMTMFEKIYLMMFFVEVVIELLSYIDKK